MITLNSASGTGIISTTAGAKGIISSTGPFSPNSRVKVSYSFPGPTSGVYAGLVSYNGNFAQSIIFPSSNLKFEIINPDPYNQINVEAIVSPDSSNPVMPSGAVGIWYADTYSLTPRPHIPNSSTTTPVSANLLTAPRRQFANADYYFNSGVTVADSGLSAPDGSNDASAVSWGSAEAIFSMLVDSLPAGTYTLAMEVATTNGATVNFRMGAYTTEEVKTASPTWATVSTTFIKVTTGTQYVVIARSANTSTPAQLKIINARLFAGSLDLGAGILGGHMYFGKNGVENQTTVSGGIMAQNIGGKFGTIQLPSANTLTAFTGFSVGQKKTIDNSFHQPFLSKIGTPAFTDFSLLHAGYNAQPSVFFGGSERIGGGPGMWSPRINEWHIVGYRYDGANLEFWLDGVKAISLTYSALSATVVDFWVGCLLTTNNTTAKYEVNSLALYNRALTNTEIDTVTDVLKNRAATSSITVCNTNYIFGEGDSLMIGVGGTNSTGFVQQSVINATSYFIGSVGGINGGSMADVVSRAASTDSRLPYKKYGRRFVHILMIGANDIGGISGATYAANVSAYMQARKAAGWDKTVLCTPIARSTGSFETNRQAYRVIVNTPGWAAANGVDAVADVGGDSIMGDVAQITNTTYFTSDQVHPKDAGYARMAAILTPVLNAL